MKTMAIICEYNPFHNGHAYQISQHRSCCGVDCVIAVMSGNFVQRGAPAQCDKWTRAKMALMGGCDLVLELPTLFAVQSAERFARGAVEMIDAMGFVDFLSFGSECGDIAALTRAAQVLLEPDFQAQVAKRMKSGTSYPAARAAALSDALGGNCANLLAQPNNLLAIEYLKNLLRLNSKTVPITLRRTAGHHQSIAENGFCSASHLRERITDGDEIDGLIPQPALTGVSRGCSGGKSACPHRWTRLTRHLSAPHAAAGRAAPPAGYDGRAGGAFCCRRTLKAHLLRHCGGCENQALHTHAN